MSTVNIQETSTVASEVGTEDEGNSTASCRVCTEEEEDSPRWDKSIFKPTTDMTNQVPL